MADYNAMSTQGVIDQLVKLDTEQAEIKKEINLAQAVLQTRGLSTLEDLNIKSSEYYGSDNARLLVTLAQKLEILNLPRLKQLVGAELAEDKVTETKETKYDINSKFKTALIACFLGDYEADMTVEDVLRKSYPQLTSTQLSLACKKLKGDYPKDKATLQDLVGKVDMDEELYYVYKIKNYELIKIFFDASDLPSVTEALKQCIIVEETPKITLKYDKSKEDAE